MANIDLVVNFDHPAAVSNTIRYARIDNTGSPSYITIPGILPGQNPYTIASVPNGQYRVGITPVYSDGRLCSELFFETPACAGINSFSATYDGTSDIDVTYSAAVSVPQVRVNISYPNGGSASQIFTNGDPISMTIPIGLSGTYIVTMQPVCDEDTGFFGVSTAPVNVPIAFDQTVQLQVINPLGGSTNRITAVTGIAGFSFGSTVNEGETQTGTHSAFTGVISVAIMQSFGTGANGILLSINGTPTECIPAPSGSLFAQTFNFGSRTYAATDVIQITYDANICDVSGAGAFLVTNNATAPSIASVTPSSVYEISAGSFPVIPSAGVTATHTGFSSILNVAVTGISGTVKAELYKNADLQQCLTFTVDGNADFNAVVFSISDTCEIILSDGGCA